MRRLSPLLVLLLALVAPASAAAGAPPLRAKGVTGPLGEETLSNETTLSRWAHTNLTAKIRAKPGYRQRAVGRLRWDTEDGPPEVYLVLGSRLDTLKRPWLKIRIPGRPNGRTGYVPEQALGPLRVVETQLVVDRRRAARDAVRARRGDLALADRRRSPRHDHARRALLDPREAAQPRRQPGLRPVGVRNGGLLGHAHRLAGRRRRRHPRHQPAPAHPGAPVARLRARAQRRHLAPGAGAADRHPAAHQVGTTAAKPRVKPGQRVSGTPSERGPEDPRS